MYIAYVCIFLYYSKIYIEPKADLMYSVTIKVIFSNIKISI